MIQPLVPNPNQTQAAKPSHSAWVTASAGTGKTKLLTDRVLNLLLSGVSPQRILCLTFTKHAASEMRTRIEGKLEHWSHCNTTELTTDLYSLLGRNARSYEIELAKTLFSNYLNSSRKFNIQTIHAFCLQLLQEFPIEAGLAPGLLVLDELTTQKWWQEIYACLSRDKNLTSWWHILWRYYNAEQILDIARNLYHKFLQDNSHSWDTTLANRLDITDNAKPYINAPLQEFCNKLSTAFLADGTAWGEIATILATGSITDQKLSTKINTLLSKPTTNLNNSWHELLELVLTQQWKPRKQLFTKKFAEHQLISSILPAWQDFCLAWLEDYRKLNLLHLNCAAARVFTPMAQEFTNRKRTFNYVDYEDIISVTAALLTKPDHLAWISYKLDNTIEHILVDEAQDTSPSQWQIISTIAEEFFANQATNSKTKTILVVGDAKQSIFSFQGADPRYFSAARAFFTNSADNYQQKLVQVDLETSYRSAPAILHLVDEVFSGELAKALTPELANIKHIPHRASAGGIIELWPLVVAEEEEALAASWPLPGERARHTLPVEALAKMLASTIHKWLREKRFLADKGRPIMPSDIMVLLRRRDPMQRLIIKELKRLQVPVAGSDRLILNDHLAVQDVMALMQWLLISNDDLSLAIVLKSPWCGLTEEELAELCINREGSLWKALQTKAEKSPKLQEICYRLHRYKQVSAMFKADKFLFQLLEVEHGRALFAARLGPDIHEPLDELLELASRYCKDASGSLAGFLQLLHDYPREIKRDLTEAGNAIRIMTAHGSKGLQAPIVILPDTTSIASPHEITILDDNDPAWPWVLSEDQLLPEKFTTLKSSRQQLAEQEYLRLLYVALTRAEDELYIMGTSKNGSIPDNCWYSYCRNTIVRMHTAQEISDLNHELSAGSMFKGQAYRYRVTTGETDLPQEPIPHSYNINNSSYPTPPKVDSQEEALPPEVTKLKPYIYGNSGSSSQKGLSLTPLDLFKEADNNRTSPTLVAIDKGIIIHALLEYGFDMDDKLLNHKIMSYLERFYPNLETSIYKEITDQLFLVLSHPIIKPLRFNKNVRREVPVMGEIDGELVQGRIDLLLTTSNELSIIDYKTGQRDLSSLNKHRAQLARYQELLKPIYPAHKYSTYLLWTATGIVEEI